MTQDDLDLLRAANPVPQPVTYSESDVARRVAEILAHDGRPVGLVHVVAPRARPRWPAVGLTAAAVLVLAVVSAVVFTRGTHHDDAAGAAPVTCAVSTSGDSQEVRTRLTQAKRVVSNRLKEAHGSAGSFVTDVDDGTIGFTPHGASVAAAAGACRASTVAIRPLVTPPVAVDTRSPRTAKPLAGLRFAVPATDAAYARLTAAQRTRLSTAMSHYDCLHPSSVAAPGLTCLMLPGRTQVLLVGPALITGPDIADAAAHAPGMPLGAQWTVALSFRAAGAARFQAFTAAYHTSDSSVTLSSCGASGPVPCADFLAITVNGRVESVPVTNAVLASDVQISGAFDQSSAQALAAEVTASAIGLRPY